MAPLFRGFNMRDDEQERRIGRRRSKAAAVPSLPRQTAAGASDTASPDHDEWLLDEALTETFPASDPIRPALRELPPAASGTTPKRKVKRGR